MKASYEMIPKFEGESDANALLYTPVAEGGRVRRTHVYEVEFEGDGGALDEFVTRVMFDPITLAMKKGGGVAFAGSAFVLDVTMKAGALDLEREAILSWRAHFSDGAFEMKKLRVYRRFYLFGEGLQAGVFVRDLVNPAIQQYRFHGS